MSAMNLLIARGGLEGSDVLAFLLSAGILLVIVLIVIAKLREAIAPRRIGNRMKRFFGPDVKLLQAHEKTFPGWDLGSLSRAVASFVDECCESSQRLGSVAVACSIQPLIPTEQENALARAKPVTLTYERLPVDVERDESFVSNALYFAITRPDVTAQARAASGRVSTGHFTLDPRGGGGGSTRAASAPAARERIAIFLAKDTVSVGAAEHELFDSDEGGRAPQATASRLLLSIACRSREVADFFFAEIERRRQALSIYRGKVIEPVINHGGVQSIAFRKLEPMSAQELELPDTVKQLIDNSIVAFYESRDTLQSMGVELKRGVLFHSPPGTGKTSICRYLAGLLSNFTVCFVSGRRLLYPRELCRMARYLQPAMLVFEDIDLIAQERDTNGLATIL
ncbi:MAG: hypothetical protein JWN40_4883, partial [Phycisphaerales bacterium]|nr:hypothetical protein [Phycisphaerales bacterium]